MRSLLIALCLFVLAAPAQAQTAPEFDPKLLLELGRVERKLGHCKEALSYYQRYLVADPQLDDATRLVVLKEIAELQPLVARDEAPRLNLEPPRTISMHYETHHDRGLIAGGVTLLGTAYAGAFITGSIILDENDRNSMNGYTSSNPTPNSAAAGTLLIPVLGPIVSAFCYLHPSWSLPWLMVDGAAQVGGLAMIIVGARIKRKVPVLDRLNFAPYGTADGGGMRISGKF
jgi:hypothetical protein